MEVGGEGDYIPVATLSPPLRMISALRWAVMRAILINVSVGSDGQSHKTVSTNHNLVEAKGEPKRYRTEVLPLTSLTLTRHAKRPAELPYLSGLNMMLNVHRRLTISRGLIRPDGA